MRLGRPTPLPRYSEPVASILLIVAGAVVLASVSGVGAWLVGGGLVAVGVSRLLDARLAPMPPAVAPAAVAPVYPGQRERITIERERRTRERHWPVSD